MKLKFWPALFKGLNRIMLMAIQFILKTVFRREKQVFHTNSICLVKFAVQLLCQPKMFLDWCFLSVFQELRGHEIPSKICKEKKHLHSHTSMLFTSSSPFKTCTLEISGRYMVHDDIIVLLVYGMCTYVLLPSMKLLAY